MTAPCRCKHHRHIHLIDSDGDPGPCTAHGCHCDRYHEVPPMPSDKKKES